VSETLFKQVNYTLGSLIEFIGLGQIGLPDLQRPFVWKDSKVRDLFDSMYRGYPVGYLLFWQNALVDGARTIGAEAKQKTPSLLIVDGQQRLTSLFAVVTGHKVLREDFDEELIKIAFNPLEEKFEVADAATARDKTFLPNITAVLSKGADIFEIVSDYLDGLKSVRELSSEETRAAQRAINRLAQLSAFPFTALELSANIGEEQVAEVFVRINSQGKPLNQSDFILTLMSVFWDEGRTQLEAFSRKSKTPTVGDASPYNAFIEPSPDQLLRAAIGLGFKRARLQHVYSILRGKDLQTGEFDVARRGQQFDVLKAAQAKALSLDHWHGFLRAITGAGYRSGKMISSEVAVIYAYVLYLIGKCEFEVPEKELRRTMSRWVFMSMLTGRYSGSPEAAMDFDLANLRAAKTGDDFVRALDGACATALIPDFWSITLPSELATSAGRSPSMFAYFASLCLLDARVLFSNQRVSDLLGPGGQGNRKAVERHHLFPKGHLKSVGITERRDVNQIANYALVEWGDNANISKQSPAKYLPRLSKGMSKADLRHACHWHALPDGWEDMEYQSFLAERRNLIARVIEEGYELLTEKGAKKEPKIDLKALVREGETPGQEFKSTLRTNLHTRQQDPRMEFGCLRTIAGFINHSGGRLIVGVADDGTPVGLAEDGFANEDKMHQHLVNLVRDRLGAVVMMYVHARFDDYQDARVLMVECSPGRSPVFLKDGNAERLFVRSGVTTLELTGSQAQEYIRQRFGH
jgi:hypothetical protein